MFTMNWRRWTRLDLKDQYFGCEIEMTGITREQAAQAVAALFGTTARQTHESHTYDPWEVTDGVGKKWRFVYDGSIETTRRECGRQAAAHDRRYSVEMNSPKLEYSEMKKLQEVIRALRHAGAVVNESCGMHVHVDASGHTPHSLRNALSIMYSKEDILFRAIGAKPDRISQYCQYSRENVVRTVRALSPHLTIRVTAADPEPEDGYAPSGVKSITMPDGTVVEGDTADFTVSANGTYDFVITDNGGNTATLHAQVGNVDTARPTVDFHFEPLDGGDRTIITEYGKTEYYNYDIIMNASAGDVGSGIERYEYKVGDGEWTVFGPADPPKFTEEQIVHIVVRVWDVAGNVSEEKARDIVLDKTPPTASHTLTPGKDGKVNINLGTDGSICGVQSITRPDGSVAYGVDTLVFEVDRNGDYDFFVWDRCGNLLKYTVPVDSFVTPVKPEPAPSEPEEPKPKPEPEPEPDPETEGPAALVEVPAREDARALTLADLACTLLSILLAILVWLHGKKDGGEDADDEDEQVDEDVEEDEPRGYAVQKTVNAVLAVLSVVLFFLTQPLVWRFRLVDWWTVLFVLLCGAALAMLIWRRRSESATEEDTAEETANAATSGS